MMDAGEKEVGEVGEGGGGGGEGDRRVRRRFKWKAEVKAELSLNCFG